MADNFSQLNVKIDAKTHYLANLAARHQGLSLAMFVQKVLAKAITREAILNDTSETSTEPLYLALWSDDEATRLFHLATQASDMLSRSQMRLWMSYTSSVAQEGKKITLNSFQAFYKSKKRENVK